MSPQALADWLAHWGLLSDGSKLGDEDLKLALEARAALRALMFAHSGFAVDVAKVAKRLDRVAAVATSMRPRVADDATVRYEPSTSGFEAALGRLFEIVAKAQADGMWSRLKVCPIKTCLTVFYDTSRSHSRRWCHPRCGNSLSAKAYRRRMKDIW